MAQSQRVRFAELRRTYRLIHECRDLGHDPAAWPRHAVEQLTPLVGAQVGVAALGVPGEPRREPGRPPKHAFVGRASWCTSSALPDWRHRYLIEGGYRSTLFRKCAALPGDLVTRTREQLIDDVGWHRSAEFHETFRPWGLDDVLASGLWTNDPPRLFAFVLVRPVGERKYGERERRLLHLFHHELSRYIGTALALEAGAAVASLPPRLLQTLECLLEGDGEKQAALRLGLSRHTVHEYVTALYRRLGVSSRPELMALCLRRRGQTPFREDPAGVAGEEKGGVAD